MPHNSPVCGHIFRFDGAFLRSKTGLFCALEKANSLLFNRSLASFRLFNIFFESSVYFPRRPGQFSNLFSVFCDGVLHRSTSLAYQNSRLVSRAKMQGQNTGVRSQKVGRRQQRSVQAQQRPPRQVRPLLPSIPRPLAPSPRHLKPFLLTPDFLAAGATAVILNARHHLPVMRPTQVAAKKKRETVHGVQ
jgi:hypothetical protein